MLKKKKRVPSLQQVISHHPNLNAPLQDLAVPLSSITTSKSMSIVPNQKLKKDNSLSVMIRAKEDSWLSFRRFRNAAPTLQVASILLLTILSSNSSATLVGKLIGLQTMVRKSGLRKGPEVRPWP